MTTDPDLPPSLQAIARSRACDLFGLTLLQGVRSERIAALRAISSLSEHLPTTFHLDTASAEHYRVLTRGVMPMASFFLGDNGLIGGPEAQGVHTAMKADGLQLSRTDAPDHLGLMLAWLSHLLIAESDAHEDHQDTLIGPLQERQRRVLDDHILRFLPVLCESVSQLDAPFYQALLQTLEALLLDLRQNLPGTPSSLSLPLLERPLAHPEHRLRDMASQLCIPSQCGYFISLTLIQKWGRDLDIPTGFGRRVDCLENLFHGAVRYERMPSLIQTMVRYFKQVDTRRQTDGPSSVYWKPWTERLQDTRAGLHEILESIQRGNQRD